MNLLFHRLLHPWRPRISKRATPATGTRLFVMDAEPGLQVSHRLPIRPGACPVSGNPVSGEVLISYTTQKFVVELVSLHNALRWATVPRQPGAPKNVEALAAWVRDQVSTAIRAEAWVELTLTTTPGPQVYTVICGV